MQMNKRELDTFSFFHGYENLKVKAIAIGDYQTPAARPKNSVLDCTKIEQEFGIRRNNWIEELRQVI